MMISVEHLRLEVIAYFVYQFYLQERLTSDKVPNDTLFPKLILMVEDIVNGLLRYLPGHPLLRVLPYEIAILASKLAVLCDDESDGFGHS